MKNRKHQISGMQNKRFFPAHYSGASAIFASLLLAPFSLKLAVLPLAIFVILCFAAPFFPWFSFYLPIVGRHPVDTKVVAITFDDGPHPESTPALLNLLEKHHIRATFYVNGLRAERYPHLIRKTISKGHTIGNHSYSHDNFIMLKSTAALKREILKTQLVLRRCGIVPHTFRPPVGITSPRLGIVLDQLGMYVVNFSRRAGDRGNRQIKHLSFKILNRLRPGDIIMLHDIPLGSEKLRQYWLAEVENILSGIKRKKFAILPLGELINRPIMEYIEEDRPSQPSEEKK